MIKKSRYIKSSKELGINLKLARQKANITQSTASLAVGLNRSCIAYYELGKNLPTIFTIIKLAEIYKTNLYELITI